VDSASPQLIAVGRVARAHGLRGRVLVVPYNGESAGLEKLPAVWLQALTGEPRRVEVLRAERANLGYLVALRGYDDRDRADELRNQEVLVPRGELPELDDGEFYAADLVGLQVFDGQGLLRGTVEDLESAGPNDLLRLQGGALVPMGLVKEVDVENRRVIIDAPDGLFDLEE